MVPSCSMGVIVGCHVFKPIEVVLSGEVVHMDCHAELELELIEISIAHRPWTLVTFGIQIMNQNVSSSLGGQASCEVGCVQTWL